MLNILFSLFVYVHPFFSLFAYVDQKKTLSAGQVVLTRHFRQGVFGGRSADRQRRRKKNHLIEAALFGRLDQMLRTIV